MVLDKSVFKAYDIRGIYPDNLDEETAYLVGKAFVEFLRCRRVVIGRDMRDSGISLFKELARGITEMGADVVDIGMCTTPMLGYSVSRYGYDGGIMISASHNPAGYNAFKLIMKGSEQMSAETGIEEIYELCRKDDFKAAKSDAAGSQGKITRKDVLPDYKKHILRYAKEIKGLKVVADYGNGVGAISGKPVLDELDIDAVHMYAEPDGSFPNHEANPVKFDTLKDIQKRIAEEKADIGIAFDGDADRSIIIDRDANIIPPDMLLAMLAEEELKEHPGGIVYYDLRFSKSIRERFLELGGKPVMMKVGNPFYKSALIHKGGLIAGEFSGHIMYKENYCIDDGLFAAVKFMSLLCTSGKDVSELLRPFKRYFQSEEINLVVDDAVLTLKRVAESYPDGRSTELDGVLIEYDNWWFSLRMSNTEPIVRLRVEADSEELLAHKRKELLAAIGGERQ
ncbi:phosphomannomutase/phosphoglucomutase [Candidatus Woesearchaeota archaeon]|nr:phosphomannomutase/phosphoglucomutase [Candidatus Woesearchaeota archaeon]